MKYAVVIPCKDEEKNVALTLESLCNQTILPQICIVIDDNSSDNSPHIIEKYASKYDFIKLYRFTTSAGYTLGNRVVQLFNFGKQIIDDLNISYDYIVKLDSDLSFERNLIERINERIKKEKYGIVSGTPYFLENNVKQVENNPAWHSKGQFKIYNKECLLEIGGIPQSLGWDCADNIRAIEKGWKTVAFPDIQYRMHRRVGGKFSNGKINHGLGAYYLGYDFFYLMLRIMAQVHKPPYVMGSVYMLMGYMKGVINKKDRILHPNQISILRKLLWGSLYQRLKLKLGGPNEVHPKALN